MKSKMHAAERSEGAAPEDLNITDSLDTAKIPDSSQHVTRFMSELIVKVQHEIRGPLNIIIGHLEDFEARAIELDDDNLVSGVDAVIRAAGRLNRTIQNILDWSALKADVFHFNESPTSLPLLINGQVEEFQALAVRKKLCLTCAIEVFGTVRFDEYCVRRAVGNLLDNALKFTERGFVSVALCRDGANRLCLEVADSGSGISPWYLPRIFEPFSQEDSATTQSFGGIGLGLAVARRFMQSNGAAILVTSKKSCGSKFTIKFPVSCEIER